MQVRISSNPPLGHSTVVNAEKSKVVFNVAVEAEGQNDEWEVQLWNNLSDFSTWQALPIRQSVTSNFDVPNKQSSGSLIWYSGVLEGRPSSARPVSFTVRFRTHRSSGWKWVKEQVGAADGELLYQQPLSALDERKHLSYYFDRLSPDFKIENISSDTPNTILWSIKAEVAAAIGDESGRSNHSLGLPLDYSRWFALVRLWSPWLAPRQGQNLPLAEKDGVLYSFLRKDGYHVVALALSGISDILTVFRYENDKLLVASRNDREEKGTARVLISVGSTFEEAKCAVMYHARHVFEGYSPVTAEMEEMAAKSQRTEDDVKANWVQDWYDGFTYCTWNGLGQNLNEERIFDALKSLETNGIRITNLIIDDNWQSLDNEGQNQFIRGWTDFEANRTGFPKGLKHTTSAIRQRYKDIQHICVWHALLGYWGGISPHGNLAKQYKTVEVKNRPGLGAKSMTVIDAPDVARMYDDFYRFLVSSGIDSVKTDAQFMLDEIDTAPARRALTSTNLDNWMMTQLRILSSHAISCMSQTPSILFPCQLPMNFPPLVVRNSDDFFPDIEESHPWHIFCNAHNALLAQHLNVLPDWDMFQTHHHFGGFHAAARCVSGGPIYVTDEPGKHDVDLINQMTGQTCRDQTVILRPSCVGRSTEAYVAYEEERLCKIAAYDAGYRTGSSFLGIFNCRDCPISEVVPLSDFRGFVNGDSYILRSHKNGKAWQSPTGLDHEDSAFHISLDAHGWDIISAVPVHGPFEVSSNSITLNFANLGLVGKMTGAVAIIRTEYSVRPREQKLQEPSKGERPFSPFSARSSEASAPASPRLRVITSLKVLGKLGLWISELPKLDIQNQLWVLLESQPVPFHCVKKSSDDDRVLEIDTSRAWKEMGLRSRFSNDYEVEVFIG